METIEIPRFLLDYFDSNTIRTPLTSIRGYANVMLEGTAGPITEDQRRFLEIITQNAERLNQYFSFVIHNQHYLAWDQQVIPDQFTIHDLIIDLKEAVGTSSFTTVAVQVPDEPWSTWVDRRHVRNAFASIAEFVNHIRDKDKTANIPVQVFHDDKTFTLVMEVNKRAGIAKDDFAYYESFLYIAQRVMALHGGTFSVKNETTEKLWLTLVFPNVSPANPKA